MTNEELKKKIVEILKEGQAPVEYDDGDWGQTYFPTNEDVADALIAAGIGEVTEWKAEAEYWEKICKFESDEHHTTIKNAAEHARHLMQERDEYKHRAEVAERVLRCLARSFAKAMCKYSDDTHYLVDGFIQDAYSQAEKELAEEGKDD